MPIAYLLFLIIAFAAGVWVFQDALRRLPPERPRFEAALWGLGVLIPFTLPIFLPLYLLGARSPDPSGTWGLAEMVGIAVYFALTLPLVAELAGVLDGPLHLSELSGLILLQNLGFVALAVFGIAYRYRLPVERLGLRAPRPVPLALLGLLLGAAMVPVAVWAEEVAIFLVGLVEGHAQAAARAVAEHAQDPLAAVIAGARGWRLAWLLVLLAGVVPLGEEVYFRGVIYGGLRARWGPRWATAGSALLFAAVHQQVIHALPILLLGVVLAVAYGRTGSLLPPIVIHAVNNVVAVLGRLYGWDF